MAFFLSRSALMARIRSRGNKETELALAKLFRQYGITGWRRQIRLRICFASLADSALDCRLRIGGRREGKRRALKVERSALSVGRSGVSVRPDFIFPKQRVAVFVDGCFWHGCRWHGQQPQQNAAFWRQKLAANQHRNRRVNRTLRRAGWTVVRVWEHQLKVVSDQLSVVSVVRRVRQALRQTGH